MKKCSRCKEVKPKVKFSKDSQKSDGLHSICKKCHKEKAIKHSRTFKGIVTMIYKGQKASSKRRGMSLPNYTKIDLEFWLVSQKDFEGICRKWIDSGYKTTLKPSIDRIDDYKPYTLDNIQLTTWNENLERYSKDRIMGLNKKALKAVVSHNAETGEKEEYYSIAEASRKTNIMSTSITKCCTGVAKTAGGLKWKFKK